MQCLHLFEVVKAYRYPGDVRFKWAIESNNINTDAINAEQLFTSAPCADANYPAYTFEAEARSYSMLGAGDIWKNPTTGNSSTKAQRQSPAESEWKFVPTLVGHLGVEAGSQLQWSTACFNVSASIQRSWSNLKVELRLTRTARPLVCQDTYFLATPFRMFAPEIALFPGLHTVSWGMAEGDELHDLQEQGVRVFSLGQSLRRSAIDMWKTAQVALLLVPLLYLALDSSTLWKVATKSLLRPDAATNTTSNTTTTTTTTTTITTVLCSASFSSSSF